MRTSRNLAFPVALARLGGAFYLVIIAAGIFGEAFVRGTLLVPDDMVATAQRIQESMFLWRLSLVTEWVLVLCATALAYVFYTLLKKANRELAIAALTFNVVAIAIEAANRFNLFSVLILLNNPAYITALGEKQVYANIELALQGYSYGFGASLAVFGVECLMIGYLVYRSQFLPRFIGVMMGIAGICYLTNTFIMLISPSLSSLIFPAILIPCFVAELSFALWLLIRGVDIDQWRLSGNEQQGELQWNR